MEWLKGGHIGGSIARSRTVAWSIRTLETEPPPGWRSDPDAGGVTRTAKERLDKRQKPNGQDSGHSRAVALVSTKSGAPNIDCVPSAKQNQGNFFGNCPIILAATECLH